MTIFVFCATNILKDRIFRDPSSHRATRWAHVQEELSTIYDQLDCVTHVVNNSGSWNTPPQGAGHISRYTLGTGTGDRSRPCEVTYCSSYELHCARVESLFFVTDYRHACGPECSVDLTIRPKQRSSCQLYTQAICRSIFMNLRATHWQVESAAWQEARLRAIALILYRSAR